MKLQWWIAAYLLVLALVILAPLASSNPDGLERLAESQGFAESATEAPFSVMAGYLFPAYRKRDRSGSARRMGGRHGDLLVGWRSRSCRAKTPRSPRLNRRQTATCLSTGCPSTGT